jgi:hypothetical protein
VLAGAILLLIANSGHKLGPGPSVGVGICIILLSLCGANGLVLVPTLALWLGYLSVSHLRSEKLHAKRNGLFTLGLALVSLVLVGLYLIGYESVPYHAFLFNVQWTLEQSIKFLIIGFGPAVRSLRWFSAVSVLLLLLISAGILVFAARNQPQERQRALGFLLFLSAMGSLSLAIGLSRDGFLNRYVTLAVPTLCCVYFIYGIYSPPKIAAFLQAALFAIACIALWPNTQFGVEYGANLRHQLGSFERDMAAGVPSSLLINRYGSYLHINQDLLGDYMPMLQRSSVGHFRFLRNNLRSREVSLPLEPTELNRVTWLGGTAYGTEEDPYLVFALPHDRYVYGIRLKYAYSNDDGTAPCRYVYWKRSNQSSFPEDQHSKYCPTGDRANWLMGSWVKSAELKSTTTVWIFDTIKEVKIYPDFKTLGWMKIYPKPFIFQISEFLLLVPGNE